MTKNEMNAREALGIKPEIQDFREAMGAKDAREFARKVLRRQELRAIVEGITNKDKTGEMDELSAEIGTMLAESGEKSLMCDDFRVTLTDGSNSSISKERLLELGVPATTILAATKKTTYTSVTITRVGEK